MRLPLHRGLVVLSLVFATVPFAAACTHHMGGCPWTELSPPTVSPSMACLEVHAADSSDPQALGGCVNPTLVGTNHCSEPLRFEASDEAQLQDGGAAAFVVEPGASFQLEFDAAKISVGHDGDTTLFHVPATVGATAVSLDFQGDVP